MTMPRLSFALFAAAALSFGLAGVARRRRYADQGAGLRGAGCGTWLDWLLCRRRPRCAVDGQDAVWNPLPSPAAFTVLPIAGRLDSSHLVGGIHGGYDWQLAPTWVVGIEGDYSWTNAGASLQGIWQSFPTGQTSFPTTLSSLSDKLNR